MSNNDSYKTKAQILNYKNHSKNTHVQKYNLFSIFMLVNKYDLQIYMTHTLHHDILSQEHNIIYRLFRIFVYPLHYLIHARNAGQITLRITLDVENIILFIPRNTIIVYVPVLTQSQK